VLAKEKRVSLQSARANHGESDTYPLPWSFASPWLLLLFSGNKADLETPAVVAGKGSNAQQESSAQKADDFQKLVGRWLRPDGGYIIEIRGFDNKGGLDVSYLNPRPINVSSAEASKSGGVTKVFIELQDVGYPGSTYSLIHDPSRDALLGIYYQAQLGQSFEVVFIRMK